MTQQDGSQRLLYSVDSPEPWFEDFGEGKLVNGRAEVVLDPDFAAVVDTSKMHFFITEHDEHRAVVVKNRSAKGFVVEADDAVLAMKGKRAKDANGTFSYRIVARRKDIKGERLAKFVLPKSETTAPPVPKMPESPTAPETPKPPRPPQRPDGQ